MRARLRASGDSRSAVRHTAHPGSQPPARAPSPAVRHDRDRSGRRVSASLPATTVVERRYRRLHVEHFTLFEALRDLSDKSVLDLACGEGFYTRCLKRGGAARVVGVDISQGMIDLARHQEERDGLGID
jgi:2-polyprenyl-3-methyl-5-hydroxy-6-metoxy-1,4-benzoquinol methylase